MKNNFFTVGIDLGGTKLAAALVNGQGKIIQFRKESILHLKNSSSSIIDLMVEMIEGFYIEYPHLFSKKIFKGVGLASAGPLNVEKRVLVYPVNFRGWKIVKICDQLEKKLKRKQLPSKVYFQNDAVASSLAEGWVGAAKKHRSYAVITVGTGIGTGVIFNGQPVQSEGMGSEFGHMIIDQSKIINPSDMHPHTVEGIASGTGILKRAHQQGFLGENIEELVMRLTQGETHWQKLFDDAADALAALIYNLSIGFNLEKILFSGGLIKIQSHYLPRVKKKYSEWINEMNKEFAAPIAIAKTKNYAGVLGAAYLPYLEREKK